MRVLKPVRDRVRILRNRLRAAYQRLRAAGEALQPATTAQQLRFEVRSQVNSRWNDDDRGYTITAQARPLVHPDARIFTMGSCFASEISRALRARSIQTHPHFPENSYDPAKISIGDGGNSGLLVHFDTFTIRQEFEIACGELAVRDNELYERHSGTSSPFESDRFFVDPYRKSVCGLTREDALQARHITNDAMRRGIAESDVLILTLGLIECWRNRQSGLFVWGSGVGRKSDLGENLEFHLASYEENLANLRRVCELVFTTWPEKTLVLTVSPVALAKTFTNQDIIVANCESKSQLRAVAGQIRREFPNVCYWPSFEIATKQDVYCRDGRHVSPQAVQFIIDNFFRAHGRAA